MKSLKFYNGLPELILSGVKTATWRINDEKNISVEDVLSLCRLNGEEFARAAVVSVKVTTFGKLTDEDKVGHEKYNSEMEMYDKFSSFYNTRVDSNTVSRYL